MRCYIMLAWNYWDELTWEDRCEDLEIVAGHVWSESDIYANLRNEVDISPKDKI